MVNGPVAVVEGVVPPEQAVSRRIRTAIAERNAERFLKICPPSRTNMSHPETGKMKRLSRITSSFYPFRERSSGRKASSSLNEGPKKARRGVQEALVCLLLSSLPPRSEQKDRGRGHRSLKRLVRNRWMGLAPRG
jgi:hypothetical protein